MKTPTVYKNFKTVTKPLDYDNTRFHDLRLSYAVASIKSGDDIKTVRESAERMEQLILSVKK